MTNLKKKLKITSKFVSSPGTLHFFIKFFNSIINKLILKSRTRHLKLKCVSVLNCVRCT